MPVHTVYTCDLCPTSAAVPKASAAAETVPLPEGWMACALECSESVVPEHMDHIAEAASNMPGPAQDWGAAFVESNMQPFYTHFYLCPACQEGALGSLMPLFRERLRERIEVDAAEMAARRPPPPLDMVEGKVAYIEEEGDIEEEANDPPPISPVQPRPSFRTVPKEPT